MFRCIVPCPAGSDREQCGGLALRVCKSGCSSHAGAYPAAQRLSNRTALNSTAAAEFRCVSSDLVNSHFPMLCRRALAFQTS